MPRNLEHRLVALETTDQERQHRVYDRVLQALDDDALECFGAVVRRHNAAAFGSDVVVSDDEKQVLCHVEALTKGDPEMRPGDLMNIPLEWMQECGDAKQQP